MARLQFEGYEPIRVVASGALVDLRSRNFANATREISLSIEEAVAFANALLDAARRAISNEERI